MNYCKIYGDLIEKRQRVQISKSECYCERHHIIPRCMGGGNSKVNLVNLTAKEHFVAHHLLHKIRPFDGKLLNAFIAMCTKTETQRRGIHISAKRYAALKHKYSEWRHEMMKMMPPEQRAKRIENIKAGCARRTKEQKERIKAKRMAYFKSLTKEDYALINEKRKKTIAARSLERQAEVQDRISRAHRKMSEDLELRVVEEYKSGKTAKEIAAMPWCKLGREGVNYLLRRRSVKKHSISRWEGVEKLICQDFVTHKYLTRSELATAYRTTWWTIKRIMIKNGLEVDYCDRAEVGYIRESLRLANEYVTFSSRRGSLTQMTMSIYDAINYLQMFGIVKPAEKRSKILSRIRAALNGDVKSAMGYKWEKPIAGAWVVEG